MSTLLQAFTTGTTLSASTFSIDLVNIITKLAVGLGLGLVISIVYMFIHRKQYSTSFALSLVVLPGVIAAVITMIGSSIATALSLGGIFSLVRFRSIAGDSKDITQVFFVSAVGLAAGLGLFPVAALITLIVCCVMLAMHFAGYAKKYDKRAQLKITVPENLNFNGIFDEILGRYVKTYKLDQIRLTNMGTLYELSYSLVAGENLDVKSLMDEIRVKNGNLNVMYNARIEEKVNTTVL